MSRSKIMAGRNAIIAAYGDAPNDRRIEIIGRKPLDGRDPRTRIRKRDHSKYWSEIQDIYRAGSPAAAREMVHLATEAEDERTRAICSGKVMDRAWGKPREYDPDKEAPKKPPPFDPSLYTTEELRQMQKVMKMIAVRQGLIPPEDEAVELAVQESRGE